MILKRTKIDAYTPRGQFEPIEVEELYQHFKYRLVEDLTESIYNPIALNLIRVLDKE